MMAEFKSIGIIGCGNMGSALIENLKKKNPDKKIFIFDTNQERLDRVARTWGVPGSVDVSFLVSQSDVVVIAVKPKDVAGVLKGLAASSGKLIISIAAGVTLGFMESVLGKDKAVVRAMPNLNAMVGQSVTALCVNKAAGDDGLKAAESVFLCVGHVIVVKESQMNLVTAIYGSSPAFYAFFRPVIDDNEFKTTLTDAACRRGIDETQARILADAIASGTGANLASPFFNNDASSLIASVSSKGGTTEAGLEAVRRALRENRTPEEALKVALRAAEKRAQALSCSRNTGFLQRFRGIFSQGILKK